MSLYFPVDIVHLCLLLTQFPYLILFGHREEWMRDVTVESLCWEETFKYKGRLSVQETGIRLLQT